MSEGVEPVALLVGDLEHHAHPDVASVPVDGLPPSQTALAWLTANRSPAIRAFARAAAGVLKRTELARYQPAQGSAPETTR